MPAMRRAGFGRVAAAQAAPAATTRLPANHASESSESDAQRKGQSRVIHILRLVFGVPRALVVVFLRGFLVPLFWIVSIYFSVKLGIDGVCAQDTLLGANLTCASIGEEAQNQGVTDVLWMGSCTALVDIRDLLEESGYLERTSFLDLIVRNNIRDMSTPEALARTTKCYDWGSKTIFYCWNAIILFTALLFPRLLGEYLHATKEAKFRRPIQELATRLVWDKYFGNGGRRKGQMAQPESKTFKNIQQNLQLFQKQKGQEVPLSHRGKWYILRDILQPSRPYAVGIQKLASRSLAKLVDLVESSEDNVEDEDDVDAEVDDAAGETDFELKISEARDQVDKAEQDTEDVYEELHSAFDEYQHARKGPQPAHASTIAQAKKAMDSARRQFDDATTELQKAEDSLEKWYEKRRQYGVKLKSERDKGKRPSVIMQAIIQVVENEERAWTFNQWLRGVWSVLWNEHGFSSKSHTPSAVASLSEKEYGNTLSAQDGEDGPSKQMTSWEEQATEYATQVVARWEKLAFIGWILSWIALVVYIAMLIVWPGANDIMATLEESVFDTIVASPGCPRLSDIVANRIVAFGGECVETETIRSFLEVLETAASIEEQIADLDSALHSFVEDGGKQNFVLRFMVQTKYCAPPSRSDQLFANINVMRAILLPSIVLPTLIFFIYVPTKHRNFFPKAFKVAIYKTYRTIKRAMIITIEGTLHIVKSHFGAAIYCFIETVTRIGLGVLYLWNRLLALCARCKATQSPDVIRLPLEPEPMPPRGSEDDLDHIGGTYSSFAPEASPGVSERVDQSESSGARASSGQHGPDGLAGSRPAAEQAGSRSVAKQAESRPKDFQSSLVPSKSRPAAEPAGSRLAAAEQAESRPTVQRQDKHHQECRERRQAGHSSSGSLQALPAANTQEWCRSSPKERRIPKSYKWPAFVALVVACVGSAIGVLVWKFAFSETAPSVPTTPAPTEAGLDDYQIATITAAVVVFLFLLGARRHILRFLIRFAKSTRSAAAAGAYHIVSFLSRFGNCTCALGVARTWTRIKKLASWTRKHLVEGAFWMRKIAKTVGMLLSKALIYIVIGIPLAILVCALAVGLVALGVAVLLVAGASAITIGIPLGVIFFIAKGVQRLVQKLAQGLRALHNIVVSHLPSRCELCALEFHRYRRWYRCPDHYCRTHRFRADTKISQCPECTGLRLCNCKSLTRPLLEECDLCYCTKHKLERDVPVCSEFGGESRMECRICDDPCPNHDDLHRTECTECFCVRHNLPRTEIRDGEEGCTQCFCENHPDIKLNNKDQCPVCHCRHELSRADCSICWCPIHHARKQGWCSTCGDLHADDEASWDSRCVRTESTECRCCSDGCEICREDTEVAEEDVPWREECSRHWCALHRRSEHESREPNASGKCSVCRDPCQICQANKVSSHELQAREECDEHWCKMHRRQECVICSGIEQACPYPHEPNMGKVLTRSECAEEGIHWCRNVSHRDTFEPGRDTDDLEGQDLNFVDREGFVDLTEKRTWCPVCKDPCGECADGCKRARTTCEKHFCVGKHCIPKTRRGDVDAWVCEPCEDPCLTCEDEGLTPPLRTACKRHYCKTHKRDVNDGRLESEWRDDGECLVCTNLCSCHEGKALPECRRCFCIKHERSLCTNRGTCAEGFCSECTCIFCKNDISLQNPKSSAERCQTCEYYCKHLQDRTSCDRCWCSEHRLPRIECECER